MQAIRNGRRIFDNLNSAMAYILAVHVPIAGITVIPVLLGLPLVLLPVHIAFLHLIIEPACSIVFEVEPEDPAVMRRPPRDPRAPLYSRRLVGVSLLQGAGVLALLLAVFLIPLARGRGELEARALTFATLVVANLALILVNRWFAGWETQFSVGQLERLVRESGLEVTRSYGDWMVPGLAYRVTRDTQLAEMASQGVQRLTEGSPALLFIELGPEERKQEIALVWSARFRQHEIGEQCESLLLSRKYMRGRRFPDDELQPT